MFVTSITSLLELRVVSSCFIVPKGRVKHRAESDITAHEGTNTDALAHDKACQDSDMVSVWEMLVEGGSENCHSRRESKADLKSLALIEDGHENPSSRDGSVHSNTVSYTFAPSLPDTQQSLYTSRPGDRCRSSKRVYQTTRHVGS